MAHTIKGMKMLDKKERQLKKQVTISMTDDEREALTKIAREVGRSLSNYLVHQGLKR